MAVAKERESFVTGLIIERPLCMHCITTKVTATVAEVEMVFDGIRRKLVDLRRDEIGHCRSCRAVGTVYRIDRPR
jgi:hypothetical protein